MITLDPEKVLLLQQLLIKETGGAPGLRDLGLLESALASAFQTFDGKELFPSKQEKAAKIGHALVSHHAFIDGNKRIGIHVMLTFLGVNGIHIDPSDDEIVRVGLSLADGTMSYEDLLAWIHLHEV